MAEFIEEISPIINRAISNIGNIEGSPINTEMWAYRNKYLHSLAQRVDVNQSKKEVEFAQMFCDALEAYRLSSDVHAKEISTLREQECRIIYEGLEKYKECIVPENKELAKGVSQVVKKELPEFAEQCLIEGYNERALLIDKLRKIQKRNKQYPRTGYEKMADSFFAEILQDKKLKQIKTCSEKMELYINSLKIVDCLPKDKYSKTAKFNLKSRLCYAISKSAEILDNPDNTRAKQFYDEYLRYRRATENALSHATNPHIVDAIRRKRNQDEWKYK